MLENKKDEMGSDSGFSLTEVIVATFLMVVGFMALSQLLIGTMAASTLSRHTMTATSVAQSKMEELLANGYENLSNGSNTAESYYDVSWTNSATSVSTLKKITVVVAWTDHRENQHDVEMSSLICEKREGLEGVSFSDFPVLAP